MNFLMGWLASRSYLVIICKDCIGIKLKEGRNKMRQPTATDLLSYFKSMDWVNINGKEYHGGIFVTILEYGLYRYLPSTVSYIIYELLYSYESLYSSKQTMMVEVGGLIHIPLYDEESGRYDAGVYVEHDECYRILKLKEEVYYQFFKYYGEELVEEGIEQDIEIGRFYLGVVGWYSYKFRSEYLVTKWYLGESVAKELLFKRIRLSLIIAEKYDEPIRDVSKVTKELYDIVLSFSEYDVRGSVRLNDAVIRLIGG